MFLLVAFVPVEPKIENDMSSYGYTRQVTWYSYGALEGGVRSRFSRARLCKVKKDHDRDFPTDHARSKIIFVRMARAHYYFIFEVKCFFRGHRIIAEV